jgi:hypothetical protein
MLGARLATLDRRDFKVDPENLGTGSLFGMTPSNPVLRALAATPIAPGIHANSIIAIAGNGPIASGNDYVVSYKSAHLEGVGSEYIVRSGHSTLSNPYTIEEVRRLLLLHAADACTRIGCGSPPVRSYAVPEAAAGAPTAEAASRVPQRTIRVETWEKRSMTP